MFVCVSSDLRQIGECFRKLILLSTFIVLISGENSKNCMETSCLCFEDFGELEYQCPNAEAKNKVVIHKEESQRIRVECWNIDSPDQLLPNITFSGTDVIISDCPVTFQTGLVFNIHKVENLKIENSKIESSFAHFFTSAMHRLTRLSIKATNFYSQFQGIVAPNLTSLDLEDVEIHIEAKLFENCTNLLKLNLASNKIDFLRENIFENLPNLEILALSQNNISYLDKNVFKNLYALRNLHLDFNDIEIIGDDTFRNLRNLYFLDISNNNIEKMRREVLRPLKSIKNIYMDYNFGIQLDDFLFSNFAQLTAVYLGNCDIKFLPKNLFTGSYKITLLSLENNQLMFIPTEIFRDLTNLKILYLNNNRLTKLDTRIFETLNQLKILNLYNNEITGIDSNVFKSLTVLEELNLSNNEITYINNDSFRNNQHLKTIHMSNNKYSYEIDRSNYFPRSPFSSCQNLEELDLSNNQVKDILDDLFIHTKHLKNLNLKGNKIEAVDVSSLWELARKGIILNLEFNHINHFIFNDPPLLEQNDYSSDESNYNDESDSIILISNNPLRCDCFAEKFLDFVTRKITPATDAGIIFRYEKLICGSPSRFNNTKFSEISPMDLICSLEAVVNISNCTSSSKCRCFWRPHDKTIIVDCSRKNLTTVPQILISPNLDYNQTEVHLEENDLEMGPNGESSYNNVTKLYLSHNHLTDLQWIPPTIEILDLGNNYMKYISQDVLEIFNGSSLKNLTLGGNPWTCECEVLTLTKFLRNNVKKIDVHSIKCQSSEVLLVDLTMSDICKDTIMIYMSLIVFLCTILSILLIVLFVCNKYGQFLRIWLYGRNISSDEELDKHKKFDVFISYSHKDEDFVANQLVSELEKGPCPYKLCLHYRDWIPGDLIVNNITSSVINSKRTLIVLSPNFLESIWGKLEFRTAHTAAMKEKRCRVILILKDDIPTDALDDELTIYLKTNTYIKYKDIWFWTKLRHALPPKKCNN